MIPSSACRQYPRADQPGQAGNAWRPSLSYTTLRGTIAWTETARRDYARRGRRYSSDLSEHEWAIIAPLLPPARPTGRPRTTDLRAVMDAVLYMASSGCQWRLLPGDFPPPSTVQRYFYDWRDSGLLATINHHLVMSVRELEGREASPSAGVIDSQSVKKIGRASCRERGEKRAAVG